MIASLDVGIVTVTDLRSEDRWPSFVEAARREKVLSLLALRMHLEGQASAGMIFYSSRPHGFGRDAMAASAAPGPSAPDARSAETAWWAAAWARRTP